MKRAKLFTAICMLAVLVLLSIFALPGKAEAATEGYYTYSVYGGEATITGCNTSISGDITIPSNLGGYPVTSIGTYAFYECYRLTSVTIPDSVTYIGWGAFHECTSLTSVTIPDSVTSIGPIAFSSCDSQTYNIYDNAKYLGNANNPYVALITMTGDDITSCTIHPDTKIISDEAFFCCDSLTSVTIPDSVTSIGRGAFYYCTRLTSVTIPDSVTNIGYEAFRECSSLESVTIGDSVTSIGDSAFEYCYSMRDVYYGGSKSKWNAISIGSDNSRLTSATRHYNHVHDYTLLPATTVNPTCTEKGYTEYTCVWGETYRDDYVPALGHSTGADGVVTPPTCTEEGYTTSTCSRCGIAVTADYVAALGHDYSGPVSTVDPTCTEQGYTGNTCIRCGDVEKKSIIDALGHKMALVPASDPTCEKPGLSVGTACQYCGLVGIAQKETAAALGGNCDFTADPTTCSNCGYVRADVVITNVVLRPSCSGLYFKGGFTFGTHETAIRYGIAVSLYNELPVADDSDATSLYTVGENSVLISNILGEGKNGRDLIYARPYVLLEDGTYIYGDVVVTNLKSVVETIDLKLDTLTTAQQTVVADLYRQNTAAMQHWLIPKIKELV